MAQENALIVLDDQRREGMRFGRVRNRKELNRAQAPADLPEDVELLTEVNHLRRRVKEAEARELRHRRRVKAMKERCETKLTNIAGVCICGAMVFAALVCLSAGTAWLAAIPAIVTAGTAKIAGWF